MEGKDPRDIHAGEKFGVCSFCVIVIKFIAKKVCLSGIYLIFSYLTLKICTNDILGK